MTGTKPRARVLKGTVKISAVPVLVGGIDDAGEGTPSPRVRLLDDEQGARIEVCCTCGRRIVIECEYPRA